VARCFKRLQGLNSKQIRLKLEIRKPEKVNGGASPDADYVERVFSVGYFDFPMIDNIHLSGGQHCAVVLKRFEGTLEEGSAEITLVWFSGSNEA
jgi:hypothetical protein